MTQKEIKVALNLGKIGQVGCVVRDLQKSIRNYEEVIGDWAFRVNRI